METVRRLLAFSVLVALAGVLAAPGIAKRPPTPSERTTIRSAMTAFIEMPGSPAAADAKVTKIRVSTINARWASAVTSSPTAGPAVAILKKRGASRSVVAFGSDTACSVAPRKVLIDLLGECAAV